MELARVGVEWDTLLWAYRERWAAAYQRRALAHMWRLDRGLVGAIGGIALGEEIAGVVGGERPPRCIQTGRGPFPLPGQPPLGQSVAPRATLPCP